MGKMHHAAVGVQEEVRKSTGTREREIEYPVSGKEGKDGYHALADDGVVRNTDSLLFKFTVTICLVICGAAMTLLIKVQDETCLSNCTASDPNSTTPTIDQPSEGMSYAPYSDNADPSEPHYFHQPFIQLFQMGLGQLSSLLFFSMYQSKHDPPHPNPSWRMFVPAAAAASIYDAFAEVFTIFGLVYTNASTAEMMKATLVVFCGLFSIYFFPGFKLTRKQIMATVTMLIGAALVIMREYIFGETTDESIWEVLGACLVLLAQLCYAGQFVVEERVVDRCKLKRLHVNKALLVFCEGIVSILMALVLQVPYSYIGTSWEQFAEDLRLYFTIPRLWGCGIGLSFAVAGFDLFGLATAETMGSDRRAVITASFQVVIVWSVSLLIQMEEFTLPADTLALVGFIVIFFSGLFYAYGSDAKDVPRHVAQEDDDEGEAKPLNVDRPQVYA